MIPVFSRRALAVLVVLLPPLSLIAPLGVAPLLGAVALLALLPWLAATRGAAARALTRDPLAWILGAFGLWSAATLLWSLEPAQGATLLPRVLLVALAGLLLVRLPWAADAALRRAVGAALAAGLALAALWLVVDVLLLDYALTIWLTGHAVDPQNVPKRGLTLLAMLVWPAALWLERWRRGAGVGAVTILVLLFALSDAGAAKLALAIGALAWGLTRLAPRWTLWGGAGLLAVGVIALPVVLPAAIERFDLLHKTVHSTQHRLVIWTFASEHALERPLTGWGFNMARSLPGGDAIDPLTGGEYIPLHTHNAPLQWWLELGLPGAVAGVAFLVVLAVRLARRRGDTPRARACAAATLAAAVVILLTGYGAWQLWWLSSLALIAALVAAVLPPPERPALPPGAGDATKP